MISFVEKIKTSILSSDINKKILKNSLWIVSCNVISKAVLLISTILISKFLSKIEYGQFGIIKSTTLMFAVFAGMELGITATKYIAQYRNSNSYKIEKIVGLSNFFAIFISVTLSILVFVFAKDIALRINAPQLYSEVQISSFVLFFSSLNGIQNGILAGLEKFKVLSINSTIAGVISALAMVFTSKYGNMDWLIIAFGSNFLVLYGLNFLSLQKHFTPYFKIRIFDTRNFEELRVIVKFSLPAILAGVMIGPVTWFCNYLLVHQIDGYKQVANFDIASQWRNTILFIPAALSQIALPLFSSNLHDKENFKLIYRKNLRINFYLSFFLVFVLISISPLIIYLYGKEYSDALVPLIIMFITTIFVSINNVIGQVMASQNKMWLAFFVNMFWAFVLVTCSYILVVIFNYGATGIAFAYLISYITHTFIQFLLINKAI